MQTQVSDLKTVLDAKLPIIGQISNVVSTVTGDSYSSDGSWSGISADFSHYGAGVVTVVSPDFVNFVSAKLKLWLSGFFVFLTLIITYKRLTKVL